MAKRLELTIHLSELKKIVAGTKKEEYRASKPYYHNIFKELDKEFYVVNGPEEILLRCANKFINFYALIEVDKIRHEGFFDDIPEGFKSGDLAYTIYIKRVKEHNLEKIL